MAGKRKVKLRDFVHITNEEGCFSKKKQMKARGADGSFTGA